MNDSITNNKTKNASVRFVGITNNLMSKNAINLIVFGLILYMKNDTFFITEGSLLRLLLTENILISLILCHISEI